MKAIITLLSLLILCFNLKIQAQNPEWIVFYPWNSGLPTYSVTELAVDTLGRKWIGTGGFGEGGLAVYDDVNWTVYDTSNAFIWSYDNFITALAVDKENYIWTATQFDGHVWKFDGFEWSGIPSGDGLKVLDIEVDKYNRKWIGWEGGGLACLSILTDSTLVVYTPYNSGMPSCEVTSIFFENNDTSMVWMTSSSAKLLFFNGNSWSYYNWENSGIPQGWHLQDVIIDNNSNKWIAAEEGLIFFNNLSWEVYTSQNSGLPVGWPYKLSQDKNQIIWLGIISGGLMKVENDQWSVFNSQNSPLPNNSVFSIITDSLNNKWIGTMGGLAVYNEIGVQITGLPEYLIPVEDQLYIFPNPIQKTGIVKFNCLNTDNVYIGICDLKGNVIHTIVNQKLYIGYHVFELNLHSFPDGFYLLKCVSGEIITIKKFLKSD